MGFAALAATVSKNCIKPLPSKALQVYDMHLRGYSLSEMAEKFETTLTEINCWINEARATCAQNLAQNTGLDFLTDAISEHEVIRVMALTEARNSTNGVMDHQSYAKYLELALKASEKKANILMRVGAIPVESERIHTTVTGEIKHEVTVKDEIEERTEEQIEADIMARLRVTKLITDETV